MKMALGPERVGEVAVKKTFERKMIIVPGTLAKISSVIIRILPRKWVVNLYGKAGDKSKNKSYMHLEKYYCFILQNEMLTIYKIAYSTDQLIVYWER